MKKIMIVFGTRPEAIKLCPLVIELRKFKKDFKVIVCVTGQHKEMLKQILDVFDLIPDYDLGIMRKNQTLFDITNSILKRTDNLFKKEKPDMVIVQGDTTTTFATSLSAFYHTIDVAHVEAGLRTNNKYSPFPEEMNRKITSSIADIHFTPTKLAKKNLLQENIPSEHIFVTGNTVIDALHFFKTKIKKDKSLFKKIFRQIDFDKRIILVTGHRRENFGEGFINLCGALKQIATSYNDIQIIYPVHLNPNVDIPVKKMLKGIKNIKLIAPLDYKAFIYLMDNSYFIISDSGGIQEEAPALGKPVLVTRDNTERPEGIIAGAAVLVGTNEENIVNEAKKLLSDIDCYRKMASVNNPYGQGDACKKIVKALKNYYNGFF